MKGKKVLVCGGSGFIGGALVRRLVELGAEVYATLHDPNKTPMLVSGVGYRRADLTTRTGCGSAVRDCEIVYACAGVSGGAGLIASDPRALVTDNLFINAQLFRECKDAGVKKVVYLSSTTGYPDSDLPMQEEDYFTGELHPAYFNPGHTRRFIERLGEMYPELNITFLRPSMVYGPGDDFDPSTSHVIPALVRKVAERQNPITVWGDGTQWRDAVYIDDMVNALVLAADAPAGAYNIASGEGMTVIEMLGALVMHANNFVANPVFDTSKPSMLKKRVLNIDKAKRVLGWEPTIRMRDGLLKTLDWYGSAS